MNLFLLSATVTGLPLLVPRGPGGTAPVDALAVLFLLSVVGGAVVRRRPVAFPAAGPLLLILGISAVAVLFSLRPATGLLNLSIEIYLAAMFFAACTELRGSPEKLRVILVVWSIASLAWAALLIGVHVHALPGSLQQLLESNDTSARPAAAARNPNLAASYLVTSMFVLVASPWPRRVLPRLAGVALLGVAIVDTGSNAALMAGVVGAGVLFVGAVRRASGAAGRKAVAGVVACLIGVGLVAVAAHPPSVNQATITKVADSQRSGLFANDLGRLTTSVDARLKLWSDAVNGGLSHSVVGVGVGEAQTIVVNGKPLGVSLHDDYLAFLLERGFLGLLALVVLIVVVTRWTRPLSRAGPARLAGHTWHPAGLTAAVAANLAIAFSHESYHFRHLWVLLALIWVASDLLAPRSAAPVAASFPALEPEEISYALV